MEKKEFRYPTIPWHTWIVLPMSAYFLYTKFGVIGIAWSFFATAVSWIAIDVVCKDQNKGGAVPENREMLAWGVIGLFITIGMCMFLSAHGFKVDTHE